MPVYPHICGEHMLSGFWIQRKTGSSPHPWGTFFSKPARRDCSRFIPHPWGTCPFLYARCVLARFIPTYVGNIYDRLDAQAKSPVHPHIRGEHHFYWPPARIDPRFIPTYVGNILETEIGRSTSTVHPHIRGEHLLVGCARIIKGGSSPHTWGTSMWSPIASDHLRFIPTYVGNIWAYARRP